MVRRPGWFLAFVFLLTIQPLLSPITSNFDTFNIENSAIKIISMKATILKFCLLGVLLSLTFQFFGQVKPVSITYEQYNNGEKSENDIQMIFYNDVVFLSKPTDKIQHYIDFSNGKNISTIKYKNEVCKNEVNFNQLPKPNFEDSLMDILSFACNYAHYSYFSNKIEVWYTKDATAKGSPYSRFLPDRNSLVLKIVINGNREIIATSINEIQGSIPIENFSSSKHVTDAEFEELKINSRFLKIQVFKNEQINFDPNIETPRIEDLKINETYHFSKGSVILKKIELTEEMRKSGYVFAKLNCKSNGDAYDRTGSVFVIPVEDDKKKTILDGYLNGIKELPVLMDAEKKEYQGIRLEQDYTPPIEILRFFTSFGANHFNEQRAINNYDWADDVEFKQDVTSLIPNDVEEIWVGVFIGNYDKGGHMVSLELDFYPSFEDNLKSKKYILPLFSTVNTMEMSGQNYGRLFKTDTLKIEFAIEQNIKDLQLLYTSTGHGGWENGDEFNPKLNQIFIDGKEVFSIVPWRTDCATYRLSNPASGNFANGLSSSDLSRSNWCPATLTPPSVIPLNGITEGNHTMEIVIDQGEDEGSSFSHWGVTGVLIGTYDN